MLRFSITFSLCLLTIFSVIGTLIFHPWGWSEYASDALYVIYYQMKPAPYPFFIVNTDGRSEPSELREENAALTSLDCSSDGRTLAYVTDTAHLYVANQDGILYDRELDQSYTTLSVANNGMVALFRRGGFQQDNSVLLVDSTRALSFLAPDNHLYVSVEVSSLGSMLWHRVNYFGLEVTSLNDETFSTFPLVVFPKWLASEQLMTFGDVASTPQQRVLVDTLAQKSVRLTSTILSGVFSPDGTQRTVNRVEPGTVTTQIVLTDPFSDDHVQQLTHNSGGIYSPVCFLTFRPDMLIQAAQ